MEQHINKIYNVDCLEFMKTLPDKCIDLIVTDPPYGMSFQSNHRKEKHGKIENDSNLDWLPEFVKESYRILKDDSHAYIFCSFHHVDVFKQETQKLFDFKNILVWMKNNTGMGDLLGDYAPQYEFCLFLSKGTKKLNNGRDSNILSFARTGNELHPTQKPLELIKFLIDKSSRENEIVFDAYLGSGTTAIAASQTKRKYLGTEIDKLHFDTSIARLEAESLFLF